GLARAVPVLPVDLLAGGAQVLGVVIGLQPDHGVGEGADDVAEVGVGLLRAVLPAPAPRVRLPGVGRGLQELPQAAVEDGLLAGVGADGDGRALAPGEGAVDVLVVDAAPQVERVPGLEGAQGVAEGAPGGRRGPGVAVVAAPGVDVPGRPPGEGAL